MRPYTICHMLSSIDGRIDSGSLGSAVPAGKYERTGTELRGDAWICGRTTMQRHFAEPEPFVSSLGVLEKLSVPQGIFVAQKAASYAISVDTHGKLRWRGNDIDGDHLICIVSEAAPYDYLTMLREKRISYIVSEAGESVDLRRAVELLSEHFGVQRLLLEGGSHINGAFLREGLIDEVSLLLVPGIDGRHGIPTVFDGIDSSTQIAVPLKLKSVEQRDRDTLWIRYTVLRPKDT